MSLTTSTWCNGLAETSLATIARKLLKRQAAVGRLVIATIEAVAICGNSGLLTASIPPDLATRVQQSLVLLLRRKLTSAGAGRPSDSMLSTRMPGARRVCETRMRTGRTQG